MTADGGVDDGGDDDDGCCYCCWDWRDLPSSFDRSRFSVYFYIATEKKEKRKKLFKH